MSSRDEAHVPLPDDQGHGLGVWLLFLAGPALWFTHFMLVYVLAEVLCRPFDGASGVTSLPLLSVFTIVTTIVFALAAAAGAVLAYRRWRGLRAEAGDSPGEAERASTQGEALTLAGFLLGALFSVAVVFTGAPAVFLQPC